MAVQIQQGSATHTGLRVAYWAVIAFAVFMAPRVMDRVDLGKLTDALILAVAVIGLNLLVGFTGQLSIGHSAFAGLGGYTTAILMDTHGWSPGWTIPAGMVVAFVIGVLVGLPALRLKGIYLALVTLALAVAFPSLMNKFDSVTGGPAGIKNLNYLPPSWTGLEGRKDQVKWFYWLAVTSVFLCWVVARNLLKSRMGRAMVATRDNQTAAAIMGVNLAQVKTIVFGISASMAALSGTLLAFRIKLVEPVVFSLLLSIAFLIAMVIGGAASTAGPIIGALVFHFGREFAKDRGEQWNIQGIGDVSFAVILIALVFVAPMGIVGLVRKYRSKFVVIVPKPPGPSGGAGRPPAGEVTPAEAAAPAAAP